MKGEKEKGLEAGGVVGVMAVVAVVAVVAVDRAAWAAEV